MQHHTWDDTEDTLLEKEDSSDDDDCMSMITFTDEDLLLGSKPHNCPLFVVGYVREQRVNRILIHGGFAVNLLPLRILKELGIPIDELSNSRLMIQGFNQGGQRAVGIIRMQWTIEDMVSTALFHVIDTKTSYNMLLESHFADAKYYIESAKKEKKVLPSEEPKSCGNQSTRKNDSSTIKIEFSKDLILPLAQINLKQPSKPPLKGFVPSTQEEEGGHEALAINEKGFDPKAFKLLIKVGYNPKEKLSLGKLPPEATSKKLHGLNATRIMLKEKGHAIQDSRVGLGFNPPKPVHIVIKRVTTHSKKTTKSSPTQKLRSLIPSKMRHQTTLAISCGKVLKVKAQTMIFTQIQSDDEDDRKSVASSNYISNGADEDIAQTYHVTLIEDGEVEEEDAEDALVELEEGVKATVMN
ncbi:UNVERIFIED_CONTAM: hypothetical protein Slati_3718600 [Sesamum latifolium]|uniref:G-patch domain-containing protein n=1 Tax=Sesamum latifolium TaxID=2727402 RepID=A0AAW2U380_9LAMI